MRIETNNGQAVDLSEGLYKDSVILRHINENNIIDHLYFLSGEELVTLINMVEYMRDNDLHCCYLMRDEEDGKRFFSNAIRYGDLIEYEVFEGR